MVKGLETGALGYPGGPNLVTWGLQSRRPSQLSLESEGEVTPEEAERGCEGGGRGHMPRNVGALWKGQKPGKQSLLEPPADTLILAEELRWTSELQNREPIYPCCFKLLDVW